MNQRWMNIFHLKINEIKLCPRYLMYRFDGWVLTSHLVVILSNDKLHSCHDSWKHMLGLNWRPEHFTVFQILIGRFVFQILIGRLNLSNLHHNSTWDEQAKKEKHERKKTKIFTSIYILRCGGWRATGDLKCCVQVLCKNFLFGCNVICTKQLSKDTHTWRYPNTYIIYGS